MKILFYRNKLNRGGIGRNMTNLANMFARDNEVVFVTLRELANEYLLNENVKRYNMTKRKKSPFLFADIFFFLQMSIKIRKILKKEKPAIIITFFQLDSLFVFFAKAFLGIPQIVSIRSDPYVELSKIYNKILYKSLYSLVDGCVFQTEAAKAFFSPKIQKKSAILNNLISTHLFDTIAVSERKDIVGVGRLVPGKAWDIAINAFSLIADKTEVKFFIYGEGDEQDYLNEYIGKLGLADRVFLAGTTDNILEIVAGAKLFLFASEHEGLPNSIIEALIVGTPCVSTRFSGGGAENLIESGANGILVPVGDYEAMAEAMLKILNDDDYARQLGQNAKEKARTEYDPERIFKEWEDYVIYVAGSRGTP